MSFTKTPYLISAIISTFNAERFIADCIEDIEAQTLADRTEIIVIDSSSNQKEGDIISDYQKKYENIRYLRTADRETVYAAWNRGIEIARGKYITSANTDDRHRKDAFEKMAALLDERPDIALVYADVLKTETENQTYGHSNPNDRISWFDWNRAHLIQRGCFIGPQPMWRRDVHAVFGGFDETLVSSGDYEFWLRISQLFNFYRIREPLGLYLERADSVEHAHADLKSTEDLNIQAEYLNAAIKHRLINCRPLIRLQSLLESSPTTASENLTACLEELEPFVCPDVQGRRVAARSETEGYLELKYRILSGKISAAHSAEVIDAIARLMLGSMEWYRSFWADLSRIKGNAGAVGGSGMTTSSDSANFIDMSS